MKAGTVEISVGLPHPEDNSFTEWRTTQVDRDEAAQMLRDARQVQLKIEQSVSGYWIKEN